MKRRKFIFRLLLAGLIFGLLFLHFYAPRLITEIRNPIVTTMSGHIKKAIRPTYEYEKGRCKLLTYTSFDGTQHEAALMFSEQEPARGTILLVHGIRGTKRRFAAISRELAVRGYHSVAMDLRGHGNSGGQHCTFGVKEKRDLTALISHLIEQEGISAKFGIWGQSLGGAVAIQALAHDKRIEYGVVESTFADFRAITNDYFQFFAGFNIRPLTNYLVYRAGKIAEFDPDAARPSEACKAIAQPILMVHGDKDRRIKMDYGKTNFRNLKSEKKTFLEIEGAGHLDVWEVGGEAYFERVFSFLDECTAPEIVPALPKE